MKRAVLGWAIAGAIVTGCGGGGGGSSSPSVPPTSVPSASPTSTPTASPTSTPTVSPSAIPLASAAFANASLAVPVGLALPNPQAVPASIPSASFANGLTAAGSPFAYSPAQGFTLTASGGGAVGSNVAISPIVVTDNDGSGNTCLVYEKQGAASATPCPFTSAGRQVTLTNSSDRYAVFYDNKFVPGAGFTISASVSGAPAPSPQAVAISPGLVTAGGSNVCCGTGSVVFEPRGSNVYAAWASANQPLAVMPYASATGYGTPSLISVSSLNGASATALESSPLDVIVGPDGNPWMTESDLRSTTHMLAVYVVNGGEISPLNGSTIAPGSGAFVEYTLISSTRGNGGNSKLTALGSFGGYVWVNDNGGDIWRINPATGQVYPNLGTPYTLSSGANPAYPLTLANGTAAGIVLNSQPVTAGGNFLVGGNTGVLAQINADTSASPSNKCTGGANPCIATLSVQAALPGSAQALATDGTNVYLLLETELLQVTPSFVQTAAAELFASSGGGLGIGADGWFWTQAQNEATSIRSIGSTTPGLIAPADAAGACNTHGTITGPGSGFGDGFTLGPDNTLIVAVTAGQTPFCGVVY